MPLYEYKCDACGCCFEELVGAEAKAPPCPSCGGEKVTRILSSVCGRTSGKSDGGGMSPFPASPGCGGGGFS